MSFDMGNIGLMSGANMAMEQAKASMFNTPKPSADQSLDKIKESAQDFEAFFLSQMMEHMFSGIETDGMFGGGHAEKVYRSMLITEYGNNIAKNGGVGVADHVMNTMIEMQEQASNREI